MVTLALYIDDYFTMTAFIVLVSAFASTLLGSLSGGGSQLIALPVWLALGYSIPEIVAAQKLSGIFWGLVASRNLLKGEALDAKTILLLIGFGSLGAWAGADLLIYFSSANLRQVFGAIILLLIGIFYLQPRLGVEGNERKISPLVLSLVAFSLGCYEGFFGSGNGLFLALLLCAHGIKIPKALGYYYLVMVFWCLFASLKLGIAGQLRLDLALPGIVGGLCGAYSGSKLARIKGAKFVRRVFIVVGSILGIKLISGI